MTLRMTDDDAEDVLPRLVGVLYASYPLPVLVSEVKDLEDP